MGESQGCKLKPSSPRPCCWYRPLKPPPLLPSHCAALVAELVGKLKVGDGLEAGITLGPMISK